jgi:spore maturation protein CgeB
MSYDEIAHKSFDDASSIDTKFKSDIVFIGTWMNNEKRDLFLSKLIDAGLNVSIWGNRWEKSEYWDLIKEHHKGKSLSGRDYVAAIQGSKICIGMLSKGNRDLHTRRSVEIPFIGGLLCAERTIEHTEMYKEEKEAIFWDDVDECIERCKEILRDDTRRINLRENGSIRVKANQVGNEDICESIIQELLLLDSN